MPQRSATCTKVWVLRCGGTWDTIIGLCLVMNLSGRADPAVLPVPKVSYRVTQSAAAKIFSGPTPDPVDI